MYRYVQNNINAKLDIVQSHRAIDTSNIGRTQD